MRPEAEPPLPGELLEPPGGPGPEEALFHRRVVLAHGRLGGGEATGLAARLMSLDALGDDPIRVLLSSGSGSWEGALTVMDTVSALGVATEVRAVGTIEGPAVGVLAVAHRRTAVPRARLRLDGPELTVAGVSGRLAQELDWELAQRSRWVQAVARAVGRPPELIEVDLGQRRWFDPEEALTYGLVDEIVGRG